MKKKTTFALVAAATLLGAIGCQPSSPDKANDSVKRMSASSNKTGSELWAQNCTRCHNIRPPEYYSDAQWDTIVHHMRLRANLTGEEARKIAEFLKSAN